MSVIIRLRGLPWSASAMNIRHFFTGLNIPAGGVHIIGGEGGDAFIAFSSDDDARMAMKMNMCPLNGTSVQLFLSSKSEMQSVIDAARSGNPVVSQTPATPAANNVASIASTGAAISMGTSGQQLPHMSTGFTGMPGMNTNNQFGSSGGGGGGFQNIQQGGGDANLKGEWQAMPGMLGGGGGTDGSFNPSPRGMSGDDHGNSANRFSGYPDNRQHQNMQGGNFMGGQAQMPPTHMGMQGMGERAHLEMKPPVQGDPLGQGREPLGQGHRRFENDMRTGNMKPNFSQFGGVEDRDKMPGFMQGPMNMDIDVPVDPMKQNMGAGMMSMPRSHGMNDQMPRMGFQDAKDGRETELMKGRLGNPLMSGPVAGSGSPALGQGEPLLTSWPGDKPKESSFLDKAPPSINPDGKREPSEPPFRRDQAKRVNRFAEVSEPSGRDTFNQPKRQAEPDFERDMRMPPRFPEGPQHSMDNMPPGRGFPDRPPGERRGPIGDDGMPSTRYPPDDDQFPEEGRYPMDRGGPDDRRRPNRFMPDEMRPMPDESRIHPNDRGRFGSDDRGFGPNDGGRHPPHGERFPDKERRFPPDQRFMGNDRNFPPNDRPHPADDRRPPQGEGRFMHDDRQGMWQGERERPDDAMRRRPGENPFPPDDPRHREREQELRRETFDRGRHGPGEWPPNDSPRGGRIDFPGRQGNEDIGGRPFPPDRRGFPGDRRGGPGFREDERDFHGPPGPPGRREGWPDGGHSRWNGPEDGNMDRPDMGGRAPPFPGNPDGPIGRPDREPNALAPMDNEGPSDMDQRISHGMYEGRRPGPGAPPPSYGHGEPPMEGDFAGGPHDFDNRAMGPRGRGGGMMMGDRPPRGRGDPFNRGRPGAMSMSRGRGFDVDRRFDEGGPPRQDVDNRSMSGDRFTGPGNQGPPSISSPRPSMGKSLLGDGPREPGPGKEAVERDGPDETSVEVSRRDSDNRYSRRDSRDRDRRYDNRRGRDRDDRDRYRSRYDRDRERERDRGRDRDRDRDRRRSRSKSRNRGSRDRYNSRDRSSRDKSSKPDSDSSRTTGVRKPEQHPSRFLHVKNMPLTISYREMRRFFHPLEIPFDGIKLINDKGGNRNGEAFVYLHRIDDAVVAQRKTGERAEGKVVLITFTTEGEFAKAIDSYVPLLDTNNSKKDHVTSSPAKPDKPSSGENTRYIVQVSNLPQSVTRQDINQFFRNLKIDKEGEAAYIEFNDAGVATGKGFVEFKTDLDYKKALTHDASPMGTSNIRVFPGKPEEADKLKSVQGEMFQRAALRSLNKTGPTNVGQSPQGARPGPMGVRPNTPAIPQNTSQKTTTGSTPTQQNSKPLNTVAAGKDELTAVDTVCVHIQGLPLLATPRDIKDFFGDCQIALRGINIAHDAQGKPLGEGFVEFKFPADFEKALKKDKTSMGRHVVAVKPINKKDMVDRLENAKQQGAPPRPLMNSTPPSSIMNQSKPPPSQSQSAQTQQSPQSKPSVPPQQQGHPDNPISNSQPGLPGQPCIPGQLGPRPPQTPSNNPDMGKGTPPNPCAPNPRGPGPDMGKGPGSVMPLLQTPQPQVMMPGGGKSFPPGVLNSSWYYVRCQNFPPDISIGEIMQFFKSFRPLGESIRLHYSSEGHATGNAVVGFAAGEDATRALQCLNMRVCRHNIVTLHPA